MKKNIVLVLFIISSFTVISAQYALVTIPGSKVRKITSKIVIGQEYELQISLPSGYETSGKKYPVVYLMDSQWDFPLVNSIYGEQYFDGFIPELIIVGVTWGGINPNADSLRVRDYTPTNVATMKQSGGADQFLNFMKTELFPYIDTNFKTDKENRTLMGCSLGGLFTLYTLLTHTDMFSSYVAATPAIAWDNTVLYQFEKEFTQKTITKPIKLFMTVGDVEKGKETFEKFSAFILNKKFSNLYTTSKVLENTGHSGTKSETYSRGLQYIFERNNLDLTSDVLNQYKGDYQFPNGDIMSITNEKKHLVCSYLNHNKLQLLANTERHFYAKSEFFNIYFDVSNDKTVGLRLEVYGKQSILKKIN
ncbi:alpha/beta hydrolase [Flavobacterium cellulosilyticum]|uniref:Alpha/beta hydrolase n=1 Tax=Flavobacterium cellulosilyticum TaxID=2541731 RepID=A0A4R5CLP9_9FLAO|nr:alpha/beta hydrolase-fold protein [Flavobacterium cellulosilyticum]TDD99323.1 alpha/beta hydrolase [Flavobacterium cellulosilyticum]